MSFVKCFKTCFDAARWWGMSCAFDFLWNYWFIKRFYYFGEESRSLKNFGPNVTYFVSICMKSIETQPANPRMSLFEKCFKSCFDTARWWGMSCAFDFLRNYWIRCFLRRVMPIFRQQKNFDPNVIYFALGTYERFQIWMFPGKETAKAQVRRALRAHGL